GGSNVYGSSVNTGTVSLNGTVTGDLLTASASIYGASYSTSSNLKAGSYKQAVSSIGGTDASNYSFSGFTTGSQNYTVSQKALTASDIAGGSNVYGSSVNTGTVSLNGTVTGDLLTATSSIYGASYSTSSNLKAGSYKQAVSSIGGTDASNYSFSGFTTGSQNYTVSKKELTVSSIADANNIYGDTVTPGTVSFNGKVSGDNLNASAIIYSPNYSTTGNLNAGSYRQAVESANLAGADAGNYTISYTTVSSNYKVTAKVVNLDGTKPFDGNVNFVATYFGNNGVINGVGLETITLTGTGTVASPMASAGKQSLSLGTLTLIDGTNGGLGTNYTLTGGNHFGTITNNLFRLPFDLPPKEIDDDAETVMKRKKLKSTVPEKPFITADYAPFMNK
ncbi:MAG TPA: hypothetical protein VN371_04905, partial [Chlorobaculum sp.]|nr:hypothetical protein [Chlorobaculum sp.]